MRFFAVCLFTYLLTLSCGLVVTADCYGEDKPKPIKQVKITDRLPYGLPPVEYSLDKNIDDPVSQLNQRLKSGKTKLRFDGPNGYLESVLDELGVPVESQLLVFSKTALNRQLIGPKRPRAMYFSDDVYIAWVPGGRSLEISVSDSTKGVNFYTLAQADGPRPRFRREESCLACHAGRTTLAVPGHMVRSFLVKDNGNPISGYSRITHATDFSKRWGGWFVTGSDAKLPHRGNIIGERQNQQFRDEPLRHVKATDLSSFFDVNKYLTTTSDVVAHLILNHQTHGKNLITRVSFESRLGRRSDAEEQLVRYLLFADEIALPTSVGVTSAFAKQFEKRGPRDKQGRSLREFDLKTRMFKYRLSYIVYSLSFHGLPKRMKHRIYKRLWDVLSGRDKSPEFRSLAADERLAILQILAETKSDLPAFWTKRGSIRR